MEFRLLGPLEVRAGDGPVPLGTRKQRALLAFLLLHANQVVARERLVQDLWGEEQPETAIATLQVYVSRLRKVLPDGVVLTRSPGYLVVVEDGALDLLRFESLVAQAGEADPEYAAQMLREALGLWRGPALAEFGSEPFALVEAGRLEELRLVALEERIEADLRLGGHAVLVGELASLIAEHPYRERLRGQLMLALYRSGRQADALQAYRDARAALDELGLEPGAALRRLERRILAQDAALEAVVGSRPAGPVALPGPLVPAPPFPFVGRTHELGQLRALLEQAEAGEGGFVLLGAEAGGGKTRLVRELAHEAAARGALVLYGISDSVVTTPHQPLREWLEALLRAHDEALADCLGSGSEMLARLLPELAPLTGPPPAPAETADDRYLLQHTALELLRRLGRQRPLLLVAEDIHWADGETLHLLRRLARSAPETRLLVVASFRDQDGEPGPPFTETLADLSRLEGVTRLSLHRLTTNDVGAFIAASTALDAPPELATAISDLTGGTPLLVCELWRDLRDSGALDVVEGRVRLRRPPAELRGPERLRDIVRQRLARLPPDTVATLELAAAAGPRFEFAVLGETAADVLRSGFVEELSDPPPSGRFTHELVRRAIYDRIPGIARAELHLRVGEALEQLHQNDITRVVAELAHHFTLAAPVAGVDRAVDYNRRAADAALAAGAIDEGAARLTTALELGITDPRERARVQLELSFLLNQMMRFAEAEAMLTQALDAATGLEERGVVARALVRRSNRRIFADPDVDPEEAQRITEAAIGTLEELGDSAGLAFAEEALANTFRRRGRFAPALAAMERALTHANVSGEPMAIRVAITSLGGVLCIGPTPAAETIRRCEELSRLSGSDPLIEPILGRFLGLLLAMAGRFEEAHDHLRRSSLVLDKTDQLNAAWNYRDLAGQAKELMGDWAGAEEDLRARSLRYRDGPDGKVDERSLYPAYQLAHLYCLRARWDDAADCLAYGADVPLKHPTSTLVYRLAAGARLATHRGDLAEALTLAERAVALMEDTDTPNWKACAALALAEVQRARGAAAEADSAVATALALYEAKGNVAAAAALRVT